MQIISIKWSGSRRAIAVEAASVTRKRQNTAIPADYNRAKLKISNTRKIHVWQLESFLSFGDADRESERKTN